MAPMSLVTYKETRPWARSIRARVKRFEAYSTPIWMKSAPSSQSKVRSYLLTRDFTGRYEARRPPIEASSSAAVVVLARSLIYSAFALLFTFFGVAAFYVLLGADFLAATQLLVYVGGILILLLFLGVVVPTVFYIVWGVMEIVSLPIAK